jgi:hypothetical protein
MVFAPSERSFATPCSATPYCQLTINGASDKLQGSTGLARPELAVGAPFTKRPN